jgi:hypothetical protein
MLRVITEVPTLTPTMKQDQISPFALTLFNLDSTVCDIWSSWPQLPTCDTLFYHNSSRFGAQWSISQRPLPLRCHPREQ